MKFAENMKRAFSMAGFKLRLHSPEILVATGVIGAVTGAVLACRATLKLDEILDEAADNVERVNKAAQDETLKEQYNETDRQKDLAIIYAKTGVKLAKLYAPAALVMGASVASILTGHSILRKRNVALAAAYATVSKQFKRYRQNVDERFGGVIDEQLAHEIRAVELTETVTDEKTGEPKEAKKTVDAFDPKSLNGYARVFDGNNPNWDRNPSYCEQFLRAQQQYANDLLRAKGYIFLNDVYKLLGFEETKAGQVVGWVYNKKNPVGDNFVDFGIRQAYQNRYTSDFEDNWESGYILDFNVDGNILDAAKW